MQVDKAVSLANMLMYEPEATEWQEDIILVSFNYLWGSMGLLDFIYCIDADNAIKYSFRTHEEEMRRQISTSCP